MTVGKHGTFGQRLWITCALCVALFGCGRTPLHFASDGAFVDSDSGPDAGPDSGRDSGRDGGICERCDDGVDCTVEQCSALDGCISVPDPTRCPPGELCVSGVGCSVVACSLDDICDDGFVCNGEETCVGGRCFAGVPITCVTDQCAAGSCNEARDTCDIFPRDDDGDGFGPAFCMGVDCDDNNADVYPGARERCGDGFDNDCNLAVDCSDEQCIDDRRCNPGREICNDAIDNDNDGAIDCDDGDCAMRPVCLTEPETQCRDNLDNDNDGDVDCQDADCASRPACSGDRELCADMLDNDGDGAVDCNDRDCEGDPACRVDGCPNFGLRQRTGLVAEGQTTGNGNDSMPSCLAGSQTAPDVTFRWTAPRTATWVIDTAGSNFDTVLYVRDGDCNGVQLACRDDVRGSFQARVSLQLTRGQTIIIVLDGYSDRQGRYALSINEAPPEVGNCSDGVDNDFDDIVDCMDSDCFRDPECGVVSSEARRCADFVDNDRDGATDCSDVDCFGDPFCFFVPEAGRCADFVDNDRDGLIDCGDSECFNDPVCFMPMTEIGRCGDFFDNDFDGRVDCQDADCFNDPVCFTPMTETGRCGDFFDNDFDGRVDCQDADCFNDPVCFTPMTETGRCGDAFDNDFDGLIDCQDFDCFNDPACFMNECPDEVLGSRTGVVAQGTTVGRGNDRNPRCAGSNAPDVSYRWRAPSAGTWAFDTRGSQFDTVLHVYGNGCNGPEVACRDDVPDSLQSRVSVTLAAGETVVIFVDGYSSQQGTYSLIIERDEPVSEMGRCTDRVDNDRDGLTDCADPECVNDIACIPQSEAGLCNDMRDNDRDGTLDCQDRDCINDPVCVPPPMCPDVDLGSRLGAPIFRGTTDGAGNDFSGCRGASAPDVSFRWRVPATGRWVFDTIGSSAAGHRDTTLSVQLGCEGAQIGCNDDASGLDSSLTLNLTRGTELVIVVDGYGSSSGTFVLNIARLITNEVDACDDRLDNDLDGSIDCADTDCFDDIACMQQCEPSEGGLALCTDGVDNDCDGVSDCSDVDCHGLIGGECCNGIDDNGDGITDLLACACETSMDCGPLSTPIGEVPGACWRRFGACAPDCSAFPGSVGNTLCARLNPGWVCQRSTGECVPSL